MQEKILHNFYNLIYGDFGNVPHLHFVKKRL